MGNLMYSGSKCLRVHEYQQINITHVSTRQYLRSTPSLYISFWPGFHLAPSKSRILGIPLARNSETKRREGRKSFQKERVREAAKKKNAGTFSEKGIIGQKLRDYAPLLVSGSSEGGLSPRKWRFRSENAPFRLLSSAVQRALSRRDLG